MGSNRLAPFLRRLAPADGTFSTGIDGVRVYRVSTHLPRQACMYQPGVFIVGQGKKRGYLSGEEIFTYDPSKYLVLSVPMPFECETLATPEEPLLAISVNVDRLAIAELQLALGEGAMPASAAPPRAFSATPLDDRLLDAAVRVLRCAEDRTDARVLGPQLVRELIYYVLRGEQGDALRAAASLGSRFGQVSRALQRMHTDYAHEIRIEELAQEVGMSLSAFHQSFKAVTTTSPLQYLKSVRLHKARLLMAQDGLRASVAAEQVGYESPSQFSREFKRMFGASPAEEAARAGGSLN